MAYIVKYGTAFSFEVVLVPQSDDNTYQSNPTLASGDFVIHRAGGSAETLDNLPTAIDSGKVLTVTVSAAEATTTRGLILASDQTGAQWKDDAWEFRTYGHASAYYPIDQSALIQMGLGANIITSGVIASNAITAAKLADDCITAAKLATDCITSDEIAASAVAEIVAGWTAPGSSQHTVTVQTSAPANVPGVTVNVYDSGNTTLVASSTTNGSGQAVFSLTDGTYKARCYLTGYTFTIPETLTVSGTSSTTITATAVSAVVDPNTYESRSMRRQKVRYNSTNDDNPLTAALIVDGEKQTPDSATIAIYAPGDSTATLAATAMTVTGTLMTYNLTTTTTASYPIATGYRADIIVTVGSTTYDLHLVFDVVKYLLNLAISKDQLVALDGNVRNMLHDSDADLSELIEACRDEIQFQLETKALEEGNLIENMVLDQSRLGIPARRYIIAQLYRNKGNPEKAAEHQEIFDSMMRSLLAGVKFDTGQDGTEDENQSGVQAIVMKT